MRTLAVLLLGLAVCGAFRAPLTGINRAVLGTRAVSFRPQTTCSPLRMCSEEPPKKTTGFGKIFSGITSELTAEMGQVDETGKRTLKATPAQIFVMVVGFYMPIVLYQVYKAVVMKGG